jgi:hypothetical protein
MSALWSEIQQKLKDLLGGWTSYVALGSFTLYLLGYLAVRFHLTALGIGTDLSVLDERYVFAGARFLVYFFSNFPIIVLFALPLVLLLALLKWLAKIGATLIRMAVNLSKSSNTRKLNSASKTPGSRNWGKLNPFSTPTRAAFSGIIISVFIIQIVMRKSFVFSNLLLEGIPDSGIGLETLLLPDHETNKQFYFLGFTAATAVCAGIWAYARQLPDRQTLSNYLLMLLASLVIVQFLFLPIYYGVFVMDKSIPRVLDLGDQVDLAGNQKAWLVWEGSKGATYLVHETGCQDQSQKTSVTTQTPAVQQQSQPQAAAGTTAPTSPAQAPPANQKMPPCTTGARLYPDGINRKLVTLPQKDNTRIQILGYDSIATLSFFQELQP